MSTLFQIIGALSLVGSFATMIITIKGAKEPDNEDDF